MEIKLGIYHHYKSTEKLYEVVGLARHTETDEELVIYKPLYKNDFLPEEMMLVRPYKMFFEDVEWQGKKVPRFTYLHS